MLKKTKLFVLFFLFFFLLLPVNYNWSLYAQATPQYNVRDIIAGKIPNIQLQAVGSELGNLGLVLRFNWTGIDSFDINIPGGTVFLLQGGNQASAIENARLAQGKFPSVFGQAYRIGGSGRPTTEIDGVAALSTEDVLIYALCAEVHEPAPIPNYVYQLSVDSLEMIPRFKKLITAMENFNIKVKEINSKIKIGQILSDEETRYAAFIDWNDEPGWNGHFSISKNGLRRKSLIQNMLPYSKYMQRRQPIQEYLAEIWRFPAQNVIWTMVPDDISFSPRTMRDDIGKALYVSDPDSLDNMMRQANDFLELLEMDRRLFVEDSLIFPINHDVWFPPFYYMSWNGADAGFAARMSLPGSWKKWGSKWQILDISYFILTHSAGTFKAAIMTSDNGKPGSDLMSQKIVPFESIPEGDFVTVDVSTENIIVTDDFFIALFQTVAENPNIILSTANNGRAYGFNGVNWEPDAANYFFSATVKLINSAPNSPRLIAPADNQGMAVGTAQFRWSKAIDPDASNIITYELQFSLTSGFDNILYYEKDISDTTFSFLNLPQEIRIQINNKIVYWRVRARDNWNAASHYSDYSSYILNNNVITEVNTTNTNLPKYFALHQNYPNPFNPSTIINFDIPKESFVTITIVNIMGQRIKTLVNQQLKAGRYNLGWGSLSEDGLPVGCGVYFIWMKAKDFQQIRKITLLR